MNASKYIFLSGLVFCFAALCTVALLTDGTGGDGDSVYHFLIARFSWKHPELFLHHWGKPVYTFIASPFAQLDFSAVKVMNCVLSAVACLFTWLIAKKLHMPFAQWIWLLWFSASCSITITLSGLTEPMFACVLALGVYLYFEQKPLAATCVVSLLPFVRSEGLVILCVCATYLVLRGHWRYLPWLMAGHVLLGVSGMWWYGDPLWVFNRIPYAKLSSHYGHGTWSHYPLQLFFMIGPVLYGLLVAGLVWAGKGLISNREDLWLEKGILVYGMLLGFSAAHMIFWSFGIFGSLGLSRVFYGVMPMMVLAMLSGLDALGRVKSAGNFLVYAVLIAAAALPFTAHRSALDLHRDFTLTETQRLMRDSIAPYISHQLKGRKLYRSQSTLAYFTGEDTFGDEHGYQLLSLKPEFNIGPGEVILWDSWSSVVEDQVEEQELASKLKADRSFSTVKSDGTPVKYVFFSGR